MSEEKEPHEGLPTGDDFDREFKSRGFLSPLLVGSIPSIREVIRPWFEIVDDACRALQETALRGTGGTQESTLHPKTLATLVLLRSASAAQGVVILAERGMVVEARTLIRGLIEDAFCMGALIDNPSQFIEMFRKDDEASRKAQANFILAKKMVNDGTADHQALTDIVSNIEKGAQNLSIKQLSELSPLTTLYLAYRVLSNDSAHPSATSLKRHMRLHPDRGAWTGYLVGPADSKEIRDALHLLMQTIIALGVGYTQLVADGDSNKRFDDLSERLQVLTTTD